MLPPIRTKYVFESNEFYRDINCYIIMFAVPVRLKVNYFESKNFSHIIYYYNDNNLTGSIYYYYYYLLCRFMLCLFTIQ